LLKKVVSVENAKFLASTEKNCKKYEIISNTCNITVLENTAIRSVLFKSDNKSSLFSFEKSVGFEASFDMQIL